MLSEGEKKYSYDSFGRMVRAEIPVEHRGSSNKLEEHAGFSNVAQSAGGTFGIQEISSATREFQVQINRYDGEGLRHEMEENSHLIKFYITKTVKLWQKKPAMEQSQGISKDWESSVLTVRRRKLLLSLCIR